MQFYFVYVALVFIKLNISLFPESVERVLQLAGKNRPELEKALQYFYHSGDVEKKGAINFLISNMDGHLGTNYYWADGNGKKVPFNELAYPTFSQALDNFEKLKKNHPGLHPAPYSFRDIDSVKAQFLIESVEEAFKVRHVTNRKDIPFDKFCEYVLPYRASFEPLQNWRASYRKRYSWLADSIRRLGIKAAPRLLREDLKRWFTVDGTSAGRKDPLPRLGAMQLLLRKRGRCEDLADLEVYILRSIGIAATVEVIPFWATTAGKHFMNGIDQGEKQLSLFDAGLNGDVPEPYKLPREPGKVLQETWSCSKTCLANLISPKQIPTGPLQSQHYLDVTSLYWPSRNIIYTLPPLPGKEVLYVNVYNHGKWRPVWWTRVEGGKVNFTNMAVGAAYLPTSFTSGGTASAGPPIVLLSNKQQTLEPNAGKKRTVHIQSQERYLVFQAGEKYSLFYWDTTWKLIGQQLAAGDLKELTFEQVPFGALLLLRSGHSKNLERPFAIDDNGQRTWF